MNSYDLERITQDHLDAWRREVVTYVILMALSAVIGFAFGVMSCS